MTRSSQFFVGCMTTPFCVMRGVAHDGQIAVDRSLTAERPRYRDDSLLDELLQPSQRAHGGSGVD